VDECKPLPHADDAHGVGVNLPEHRAQPADRGLHSFRFQLNLSSSVHRVTQLDS